MEHCVTFIGFVAIYNINYDSSFALLVRMVNVSVQIVFFFVASFPFISFCSVIHLQSSSNQNSVDFSMNESAFFRFCIANMEQIIKIKVWWDSFFFVANPWIHIECVHVPGYSYTQMKLLFLKYFYIFKINFYLFFYSSFVLLLFALILTSHFHAYIIWNSRINRIATFGNICMYFIILCASLFTLSMATRATSSKCNEWSQILNA